MTTQSRLILILLNFLEKTFQQSICQLSKNHSLFRFALLALLSNETKKNLEVELSVELRLNQKKNQGTKSPRRATHKFFFSNSMNTTKKKTQHQQKKMLDLQKLTRSLFKYFLEGIAVALAAYYIPRKKVGVAEVAMIAVTAGLTFMVLDMFSPSVGSGARLGAGLGIGLGAVTEGMDDVRY